jgi:hypothetical protein
MIRDVHPAEVVFNDGRILTKCRVFLTSERIIIWRENVEKKQPEKIFDEVFRHTDARASRNTLGSNERIEVFGADFTCVINKGHGCNCGSSLKALATPISWFAQ